MGHLGHIKVLERCKNTNLQPMVGEIIILYLADKAQKCRINVGLRVKPAKGLIMGLKWRRCYRYLPTTSRVWQKSIIWPNIEGSR